jgi:hypothetical protein
MTGKVKLVGGSLRTGGVTLVGTAIVDEVPKPSAAKNEKNCPDFGAGISTPLRQLLHRPKQTVRYRTSNQPCGSD